MGTNNAAGRTRMNISGQEGLAYSLTFPVMIITQLPAGSSDLLSAPLPFQFIQKFAWLSK